MGLFEMFMEFDDIVDFLKKLVEVRKKYIDYFIYGEYSRPGILSPPAFDIHYDVDKYGPTHNAGPFPSVTQGVW